MSEESCFDYDTSLRSYGMLFSVGYSDELYFGYDIMTYHLDVMRCSLVWDAHLKCVQPLLRSHRTQQTDLHIGETLNTSPPPWRSTWFVNNPQRYD